MLVSYKTSDLYAADSEENSHHNDNKGSDPYHHPYLMKIVKKGESVE